MNLFRKTLQALTLNQVSMYVCSMYRWVEFL